ncbi:MULTISPECIES: hypothetical protein [Chromobacterium]|uniref:CIS tube protein n=1 Tax=Chromobacterium TaxID=535 RepID=UPI001D08DBFB|nr:MULTISPECIES: hypothetical protein [Chromobacterium]MCP1293297.1 hypothetical protein [Chromobacterium sp. S0633]UJB32741.1 hypothetical protein HQN78_17805 [Chromobacterium sp. Beijing]
MKGLLELGLSKLKIQAYQELKDGKPNGSPLGEMQVMYNPESLNLSYGIEYDADNYLNGSISINHFKQARPGALTLELLFDSSLPGSQQSVEMQLTAIQALCCETRSGSRETPYLKIEWGKMHWHGQDFFLGRAASLEIRYTRFDRKAEPQRATATLTLNAVSSPFSQTKEIFDRIKKQASLSLPDQYWLPMAAATLATIAGMAEAYSYLDVAIANDLDSLDAARPGDTLVPPTEMANEEGTA